MDIHSCSYFCERPECIKQQRDELRAEVESQSKIIAELTFNQRLQDAATAAVQERAEKAQAKLTEISELRNAYATLEEHRDSLMLKVANRDAEIAQLRAKLAEAEKDAGRYRRLRDGEQNAIQKDFPMIRGAVTNNALWDEEADAAIDAELAK